MVVYTYLIIYIYTCSICSIVWTRVHVGIAATMLMLMLMLTLMLMLMLSVYWACI